jgi:hypothetical protein
MSAILMKLNIARNDKINSLLHKKLDAEYSARNYLSKLIDNEAL